MTATTVTRAAHANTFPALPVLAATGGTAAALLALGVIGAPLLAWMVPVVWAAAIDARCDRLPDRVVLPGALMVLLLLAVAAGLGSASWSLLLGATAGGVVLGAPCLVVHVVSPAGFGYGDVKFGLLVGLGLGMLSPAAGVVVFLTASLLGVVSAWVRPWPVQRAADADRRSVPFGPPLAIAALGWVLLWVSTGGGLR